jgi:ferrochelatase
MRPLPEPPHTHGASRRTAVLLVNLGTPQAPTASAVRRYLREFLSDPRVVEIPRPIWLPILYGPVLAFRPAKSAAKYAKIWTDAGSPLLVYSREQAQLLRGYLGARSVDVDVHLAMRYGEPSIANALDAARAAGTERLLVLPMYPQYSATTTASVFDAVSAHLARTRNVPELRWVKRFHDQPGYIEALKASVHAHWTKFGHLRARGAKLVLSFHGVPRRVLDLGDPYHCECYKTARLLTEALQLNRDEVMVCFQSRFGRAEWLKPYTAETLQQLARAGTRSVDLMCPGFAADCLETLEEVSMECRADYLAAGGREFNYVPCLNGAPAFIHALADLVCTHLAGWPVARTEIEAAASDAATGRELALALGANR